jgi:3-hydroxyacyl-CoA dehydrogenase
MAIERVRRTTRDGIGLIVLDSPPVNALGAEVVTELAHHVAAALADAAVRAVVIAGDNAIFSGGADIRAFRAPPAGGAKLGDVLAVIEAAGIPFVAAIDGNALGGGLELALACDARIATPRSRLGQPEINLGLLPGAGGTQRLPRLIGLEPAVEMIVGGAPVGAARALELGLVDALAEGDVRDAAFAHARSLAGGPRRRASELPVRGDRAALDAARARAEPVERGGLAAHHAISAIAGALELPFAEALVRERALFDELRASEQSLARVHLFFAERAAAKGEGLPAADLHPRTAAVIGSGTMGRGIAMTLANVGIDVTLVDLDTTLLAKARENIESTYAVTLRRGRITQPEIDARLARISYVAGLLAAAHADLVIEAVFEEMDLKQDVFRELDRIVRPDAILATNTSTLDVDAIAGATARPERVTGTHFFSPANVMKLLEIVRGSRTSPQAVANALALAKQLKKVGVVAGNCDGFIGNRMLGHYRREAEFLLEEGASPDQVDRVMRAFGFPMGPFATNDLTGLDVSWRVRKRRRAENRITGRSSHIADRLCELGRFGQKTGAGYYRYEPGSRTPHPDPVTAELIAQVAAEAGIERRTIGDDEILKRCMYPLVNEAAAILADGTAERPGDIDVVWVYGYGFPAFRGGPLRWADSVGLRVICDEMRAFEAQHGAAWVPAPLLAELAARGASFGASVRGSKEAG